jgi:ribosomal protein S18 acetylase RimI-like enzyme
MQHGQGRRIAVAVNARAIVRLGAAGYAPARQTLGRAFFAYNLMVYAAADDARRRRGATTVYGSILADSFRHGEVYTTDDGAGVACWLPPGCGVPGLWRQIRAGMLAIPFQFGPVGFRRLIAYENVSRRLHHTYAPMPHWYLYAIGVEPQLQGQGIGSLLLSQMAARVDAAGMPCYLDTHQEQNVRLYQRHGFEVAECSTPEGHPIPVWAMVRKPR